MSDTTTKLPREEKLDRSIEKYSYKKIIEEVRKTYDSLAEVYDYFYPPISVKTNHFMQSLHNFLQESGVKRILDCACGTGRELIPLAETGCYQLIVGSDLSSKMLKKARQKALKLPIKWVQSDWSELPEKVEYKDFDAILCLGNPFAHIPPWSYGKVFASIQTLLKVGGLFVFNRRNWEAELGEKPLNGISPKTTIYKPYPTISLLNVSKQNNKEFFTYFTYHHYDAFARLQILHLLEINKNSHYLERAFMFRCFYVKAVQVRRAILSVGFRSIARIRVLNELQHFDAYAEEDFMCAIK